jgi:hypothetical protein
MTPFPHSAHRTGPANLSHPALGQDFTPSPTTRRAQAQFGNSSLAARSSRIFSVPSATAIRLVRLSVCHVRISTRSARSCKSCARYRRSNSTQAPRCLAPCHLLGRMLRLPASLVQQGEYLVGQNWPSDEISLDFTAIGLAQVVKLLLRFHTFCDNADPQILSQSNDGFHDGCAIRLGQHVADKGLIDLDAAERKFEQMSQRRITCSKVIKCDCDS